MFGTRKNIFDKIMESNRNLIVNGDISSGKTSNIIFPLIDRITYNEENYLFLDSKEEYLNKYYGYLKNKDYNIIIINLQNPDRTEGLNVLEYPYILYNQEDTDKALEYIENIAYNIFNEKPNNDSFWVSSCCDLFIGLCLILFEEANKEEINFNSIYSLIDNPNLKNYILKKDKRSNIYNFLSGTLLAPKDTKGGIITTFKQQLRKVINKDKINNLLSKTTIDLEQITTKKTAIFIIARDDNKDINITAAIIIDQLFKIIFDNNNHQKYNFVLDNIDTINNINNLSNMLSSGIPRNISFIIGTRSLDDFNKKYTKYIDKLCNILSINDNNVEAIIDNKYEKIHYSISKYNYSKENIDYPIINKNNIKIYSLNSINKSSEKKEEFTTSFINKSDENIFSIYEDNRVDRNKHNNKKNNVISKPAKEIDNNKDKNNIENINKKIKEIENNTTNKDLEESNIDNNITTEDLLRIIDERIHELEQEELKETKEEYEVDNKFNNDIFPKIDDIKYSYDDIFPKVEKSEKDNKKEINNNQEILEETIDKELEQLGYIKYIDEEKYYMNGYNTKKQELLKEKYNLDNKKNSIF